MDKSGVPALVAELRGGIVAALGVSAEFDEAK